MKKTIQIALCVFCAVILISLLLTVSVHYATNCKKHCVTHRFHRMESMICPLLKLGNLRGLSGLPPGD